MNKKNVTIYEIARAAGVSPSTVSRVLNGHPVVKESTKQRILALMEQQGFSPNEAARNLTKKQTNVIGFIVPDITNPFFSFIYMEFEKQALEKNCTVLLRNSMSRSEMESLHLKELTEKRVDAIIFMGGRINKTKPSKQETAEMSDTAAKVPLIMVNGRMKNVSCCTIRTNEKKGMTAVVDHLVGLGHQKIALIGGIKGISTTDEKLLVFKQRLKKHQLAFHSNWHVFSGYSVDSGKKAMGLLLDQEHRPSAVIGINDLVVYGAYKECRNRGVSVGQFAFAGFDDSYPSELVYPSLTSVNHNYEAVTNEMIEAVEAVLAGKEYKKNTLIPVKLVERESSNRFREESL